MESNLRKDRCRYSATFQLAVARVLKMSGAADVTDQLRDDADDSDFPRVTSYGTSSYSVTPKCNERYRQKRYARRK